MTKTFDARAIGEACMCLAVQRAARAVARRYDEALRPTGLSNGQMSILVALAAKRRWGVQTLAAALAMDRTTVTAALKPLMRDGLVEMAKDYDDQRLRIPRLTKAGEAILAQALPLWEQAQAETAAALKRRDLARLRRDLGGLSDQAR